jgi:uncharacterized protein (TIGR02145 family)
VTLNGRSGLFLAIITVQTSFCCESLPAETAFGCADSYLDGWGKFSVIDVRKYKVNRERIRGAFVDHRDLKSYRYVTIGEQCWMIDNLSYRSEFSRCPVESRSLCNRTGRLYQSSWLESLPGQDSGTQRSSISVCPKPWRIPILSDWQKLFATVGSECSGFRLAAKGWIGLWPVDIRQKRHQFRRPVDSFGFFSAPYGYERAGVTPIRPTDVVYLAMDSSSEKPSVHAIRISQYSAKAIVDDRLLGGDISGYIRCICDLDSLRLWK